MLARLDEALGHARDAVDVLRSSSEPFRPVTALMTLADVRVARGEFESALRFDREAVTTAEELGTSYEVIRPSRQLGHRLLAAGARTEAVEVWREAHRIGVEHDDPVAEELEELLEEVRGTP